MAAHDPDSLGEQLSAYLDGELDAEETRLVEEALRADPMARAMLSELRQAARNVTALPRHAAPSSLVEELQTHLERTELLDGVEVHRPSGRRRRAWLGLWTSVAALVAVLLTGRLWWSWGTQGVPLRDPASMPFTERPGADERSGLMERSDADEAGDDRVATSRRARSLSRGERLADARERPIGSGRDRAEESVHTSNKNSENLTAKSVADDRVATSTESTHRERNLELSERSVEFPESATVEGKLSRGADERSLRSHRFENESLRLRIELNSASAQDDVLRRIVDQLVRVGVNDLGKRAETSASFDGADTGQFFHVGQSGVNFTDPSRRQILVRANVNDVKSALNQLAPTLADESVTLFKDRRELKGLKHIVEEENTLFPPVSSAATERPAVDSSSDDKRETGHGEKKAKSGRRTSRPGAADELLRLFGLDRDWLRRVAEAKPKPDTVGVSAPTTGSGNQAAPAESTTASTANRPSSLAENEASPPASPTPSPTVVTPSTLAQRPEEPSLVSRRLFDLKDDGVSSESNPEDAAVEIPTAPAMAEPIDVDEADYSDKAFHAHSQSEPAKPEDSYVTLVIELTVAPPSGSSPTSSGPAAPASREHPPSPSEPAPTKTEPGKSGAAKPDPAKNIKQ